MNIIIQSYRFLGKARFGRLKAEMKCTSHKQTNLSDLSSELVCEVRFTDKCSFILIFTFILKLLEQISSPGYAGRLIHAQSACCTCDKN